MIALFLHLCNRRAGEGSHQTCYSVLFRVEMGKKNEKLHFVINVWPFTRRGCKCGVAVFGTSHPVFAKDWWLPLPLNFIRGRKGPIWLAKLHVQKQTINTFSWWTKLEYRTVTHNSLILKTNSLLFFLKVSRQMVIWMTEVWINSVLL